MTRTMLAKKSQKQDQKGIVLVIALVVLVAMTLAAIALSRSVDIATQIAGNLAYRQSGVQASDGAVEIARDWLRGRDLTSLNSDMAPSYYSSANGGVTSTPAVFDPLTFDWSGKSPVPMDAAGNTAVYVIHRMCDVAGGDPSVVSTNCFTVPLTTCTSGGAIGPVPKPCSPSVNPYYRITVRISGPKNTVTYTQAVIY